MPIEHVPGGPQHRSFGAQALHYFTRAHTAVPTASIDSPAAWTAPEMRAREAQWRVRLSDAEIAELDRSLDALETAETPMAEVDRHALPLPTLGPRLVRWGEQVTASRGFVVLGGLPVERWGEQRSALAFWALGHHLGVPGAQNAEGELLGHVVDYEEQTDSPHVRLYRTKSNIDFHCDAADIVGLLCLRTARSGGRSRIASSVAIFNALLEEDAALAQALFEPIFLDRRDEQPPDQSPVLELPPARLGSDGVLRTFYHSEYFRSAVRHPEVGPLSKTRAALLDRYDALAASPEFCLEMDLVPGDIQLISNHTIIHARTDYEDWPEPERKRHLLRLWLSSER